MNKQNKNIESIYPLSPMQQGMLFHTLYAPDSGVYFEQLSCTLYGNLNVPAFERAWQRVVERHPVLRTLFIWEHRKQPLQIVRKWVNLPWVQHDWRGLSPVEQQERLEAFLQTDREQGFKLDQAPLMRCTLIKVREDTYHFVWSRHHILLDGWCLPIILKEVLAFYEGFNRSQDLYIERPRPYRDYIAWLQQQDLSQAEAFWRQALQGFTAPTPLVVDRVVSNLSNQKQTYDRQHLQLSANVTAALQSLAQQHHLTLNTLVQGAWALLLSRYSGQEDVVFGVTVSGRPATIAGVESMVGLFINTLPVRVQVPREASLLPWLKQIQNQQVELRQYEYSPLVQVQRWSEVPDGLPLFESIVVFENYPVDASLREQGGNIEIRNVSAFEQTNYPLTMVAVPGSELSLQLRYDCRRFDAASITRMLGHLQTLLEGIVAHPEQRLEDLPLLTQRERLTLLVEWNHTQADYPKDKCIHQLFEAQVELTPDAVAVVFEDKHLTYRELNCRANKIAHHLRYLGVGPDGLVGLCLERSLEMVVGLLGILKAGGAYVPLDPAYPRERLAFMLEDAQVLVLLTQQRLLEGLSENEAQPVCLDTDWEAIALKSEENLASGVTVDNLAYAIYTSGSTGRPKGAIMSHRPLSNLLSWQLQNSTLPTGAKTLQFASVSFDVSFQEIFSTWCSGGTLILISEEVRRDAVSLLRCLTDESVQRLFLPFVALQQLAEVANSGGSVPISLREIITAGEQLQVTQQIANLFRNLEGCVLHNHYGPSESHVITSFILTGSPIGWPTLPSIGRPIANVQIYLLDSHLQPVPVGVPGELYIGGVGLARGYRNRPELTAEKFIAHPFSNESGARLYKTGDLARYLPDGNIEFLGRIDHQVKIRGFRIELGEIEAVLSQYPGVRETVVVVREDEPGSKRLVAYVVLNPEQALTITDLRRFLEEKLPQYMVPTAFVMLEALPLTPSGKVNRRALPVPDKAQLQPEGIFVAPQTPVEELLAGIWAEVLGVEKVGIHNNFFELGGHSLLATRVISQLREVFKVELPLRRLFETPTVAGLAKDIETATKAGLGLDAPRIEHISRLGELPLSFAQQRLWFLAQLEPDTPSYNISAAVRLQGRLNVAALEQSLNEILRRHEVLRTAFKTVNERPVQVISSATPLSLPIVDLSELLQTQLKTKVKQLAIAEAQQPFALDTSPMLRVKLLRLSKHEHVALFTMHHIASDGWSIGVLVRELAPLYQAFCTGQPSPLTELPIQYADFTVWQRQWLQGEVLEAQLAYWKQQLESNLPVLQLPTARPRAEVKTSRGATNSFVIHSNLSEAIQALSRQEGVTLFMALLAGFQVLLQRYTNQDDIVVGTDVANRNRAETESLIGFFVNLLVLRTDLSGNPSFRELLLRVREVALGAYAHQDLPFDKLVGALRPKRDSSNTPPLFQVLFVLQNAPMPALDLPGLTLSLLEVENEIAKFDLALFLTETEQGIVGNWRYNADLFETNAITRLSAHFKTLLKSIVAQPDARINNLEMLTDIEKEQQAMKKSQHKASKLKKFMAVQPKAINLSQETLIKTDFFQPGETLPLVITPDVDDVDILDWATSNREFIETKLLHYGAILFRNFGVADSAEFESLAEAICPRLFGEYGDLPREGVSGKVYGSTPYPSGQVILFHNESSHMHCWPQKIWFFCVQPAQQGGETPIVDCRKVFQLLDPKLREKFASKQLMYVRNYTDGLDVSWQDFFHTTNRAEVEEYCRKASISVEWKPDGGLRTCQVRPAVVKHPKTGEPVFFNQIQLHHASYLKSEVRESLLSSFGENNLPRHVYYGDRSPIEDSVIEEILAVYKEAEVSFSWQKGDVLMLDNMLTAHGRNLYVGPRKIVVAMGEMIHSTDTEHKGIEKAYAN
ncbi:MAG: amino acid adenylation domain-containing protein [Nostoc indistinguendum CM1-VF10]|jgi:amino acid adenylation domain-containing protein|nr:amino acid adenylation domain-containing protein [Nostoc indistinguendum CM1-VF10]